MEKTQQKSQLRQQMLEKRLSVSVEKVHELSQQIQSHVMSSDCWKKSRQIGLYASVKNEVETKLLFMTALEQGKFVYFPRVEQGIRYYEVKEPSDLQKGAWGISEPSPSCTALESIDSLDLIVVPGVVFDKKGHRLGYGKGFYDRILSDFSNESIGLAYEFQIEKELPTQSWDCSVKRLITEKNEYHF